MLENFHLAAIVRDGSQTSLWQILLDGNLQDSLARNWGTQYDRFVDEIQEIDFNAGYKPERHERFRLTDYKPPSWIAEESSLTIPTLRMFGSNEASINSVKGIVAFARNAKSEEVVLFQNFTPSHVIRPSRFLLPVLENGTYTTVKRPGLNLSEELSAVYHPAENRLLFRNFRSVNAFLPIEEFYEEASEQEIRAILDHDLLMPEDPDALAVGASQWSRKRFAMLRNSGILDMLAAEQIKSRSPGHTSIKVVNGKIVFPSDKSEAKKLLQFLNEELFKGPLTDMLYETNSKRQAD